MDFRLARQSKAERSCRRFDRFVAAVGITREIGFAHTAHEIGNSTPVSQRRGRHQKHQIARRDERRRQSVLSHLDFHVAGQRRAADRFQRVDRKDMIFSEFATPVRKAMQRFQNGRTRL